ncbi:nucleotide cyclase [Baffinella frigidus]|nr:nucleotide cyclase [Cryptophyta sp. CCMP2293]
MRPDEYKHCTVVQMDIKGFTAVSSIISADELVDLVNAIFTSIDKAAELVGKTWKVETIGDCYQVLIGGPFPCQDHAQRGMELAFAILHLMHSISERLQIPVRCRCGVHTGKASAAVMGTVLPRYLIYGPDVMIARQMEATAQIDTVQVSDATRQLLGADQWQFSNECDATLPGGTTVKSWTVLRTDANFAALLRCSERRKTLRPQADKDLATYLGQFEATKASNGAAEGQDTSVQEINDNLSALKRGLSVRTDLSHTSDSSHVVSMEHTGRTSTELSTPAGDAATPGSTYSVRPHRPRPSERASVCVREIDIYRARKRE